LCQRFASKNLSWDQNYDKFDIFEKLKFSILKIWDSFCDQCNNFCDVEIWYTYFLKNNILQEDSDSMQSPIACICDVIDLWPSDGPQKRDSDFKKMCSFNQKKLNCPIAINGQKVITARLYTVSNCTKSKLS
jgi:hypothetical protein